jgi:DNA polymerase III, epsilon subunit and related 3''-5'' exonucleases
MTSWREASFAVVDLETTGLDPQTHEVLSVGVVPVDGGRIILGRSFYSTVRPLVAPDSRTVVIHGIRPVDAAAARPADEVARELVEQLGDRILVAHVVDVERGFLTEWLRDAGYQSGRVVDTDILARVVICRRGGPLVATHVGLGAAAAHFGLPEHRRHHALGDALTTAQLFLATATLLFPDRDASVAELLNAGRLLARERRRRWPERTGKLMRRLRSHPKEL